MRRGCAALVAAALVAAGCGSQNKMATGNASAATSAGTPASASGRSTDCNTLGIDPTGMREGTCTHAGVTYVIVDENHTLKLPTLTAQLGSFHTASSLSGSQTATARGKFLVIAITVTNRLSVPQAFDRSGTQQAGLILDRTVYTEDAGVEKASDPSSCLSRNSSIAAGKSTTCAVIFEVPTASAADLGQHGSGDLYLVDFGSDLAASSPPQTVGQIRLYR